MKSFLVTALVFWSSLTFGNELFVIKKTKNPKNVIHYKAHVLSCKLKSPGVSSYWIMGEEDGHSENLTAIEKPYFKPDVSYLKDSELDFSIGVMDKLGNKLPNKKITVRLENCKAKAYLEFKGQEIQLREIFAEVSGLASVNSITLKGTNAAGNPVSFKIDK